MDHIEPFTRVFLASYFLMIGIYYSCRSYAMSERHGFSFISYGKTLSLTWFNRQLFNLFRASILGVCICRAFLPEIDAYLGIIPALYRPEVLLLGIVCLLLSYGIITYVAGYMDKDWRSGLKIDSEETSLLTGGPFSRSRNPQYIGIITGQLGFFLAIPCYFTALCLVIGVAVIILQSKAEEQALEQQFGADYLDYKNHVPKWL